MGQWVEHLYHTSMRTHAQITHSQLHTSIIPYSSVARWKTETAEPPEVCLLHTATNNRRCCFQQDEKERQTQKVAH